MAIFKYKHSDGTIKEMPVISNTYTEYVTTEDISPDPQILLTPSKTTNVINEQKTFNKVTASIDLLSTIPTYTYNINDRNKTIIFNSDEWKTTLGHGDKFPTGIEIVLSNNWLNKNTESSTPPGTTTISTKTGTVTIPAGYYSNNITVQLSTDAKNQLIAANIAKDVVVMGVKGTHEGGTNTTISSNAASASTILEGYKAYVNGSLIEGEIPIGDPPSDLFITTPSEQITVPAGYYSNDVIIKSDINNRGYIKNQTQIKPSNYSTTYYNTGYYTGGSTNGKINIATGAIELTANKDSYTYSDWGDVFPTSIKVNVPDNGIDTSAATSYTTLNNNKDKIPKNYVVYGSGSSSSVTGTMELYTHTNTTTSNLTAQGATRTIEAGYHDGKEIIKVQLPTNTMTKTFTDSDYSSVSRSAGYYNSGTISINSNNLKSENIRATVTILGVPGNDNVINTGSSKISSGQTAATASQILSGYSAFINGAEIKGSYTAPTGIAGKTEMISTKTQTVTIPAGTYSSASTVSISSEEKAKIIPENIKQDITILGITGTCVSYDSTSKLIGLIDKSITKLDLPHGITKVGNYVFYNCKALTNITIPDSAASIESLAFQGCTSLQEVIFRGTPNTISSSAFSGDTNITDIYVPWSVGEVSNAPWGATNANIHYNAIEICYGQQIYESTTYWYLDDDGTLYITGTGAIPSWTSSGQAPWYDQTALIKKVAIGDEITNVPKYLCYYTNNLTEITIGKSVTSVDMNWVWSTSFSNYIVSSQNINYSAVDGLLCNKSGTTLHYYPGGRSTTDYDLPSSITKINNYAFSGNKNLKTLRFNQVTDFGTGIIRNSLIEKVYFKKEPQYFSSGGILADASYLTDVYVPWSSSSTSLDQSLGVSSTVQIHHYSSY